MLSYTLTWISVMKSMTYSVARKLPRAKHNELASLVSCPCSLRSPARRRPPHIMGMEVKAGGAGELRAVNDNIGRHSQWS